VDLQAKKTALRKIPHGIFIVGVCANGQLNAFTGSWLTQASFTPPLVVMGVKKDTISYTMIAQSKVFSVSLLGKDGGKRIAEHFVKPAHTAGEKLAGIGHTQGRTGAPILDEAIAYFECEVRQIAEGGDHAVVIGEVVEAGVRQDVEALTLKDTGWQYGG